MYTVDIPWRLACIASLETHANCDLYLFVLLVQPLIHMKCRCRNHVNPQSHSPFFSLSFCNLSPHDAGYISSHCDPHSDPTLPYLGEASSLPPSNFASRPGRCFHRPCPSLLVSVGVRMTWCFRVCQRIARQHSQSPSGGA
jgi:hypothetical protein